MDQKKEDILKGARLNSTNKGKLTQTEEENREYKRYLTVQLFHRSNLSPVTQEKIIVKKEICTTRREGSRNIVGEGKMSTVSTTDPRPQQLDSV